MFRRHGPIGTLIQIAAGLAMGAGVGAITHTHWLLAAAILAAGATLLAGRTLDRPTGDLAAIVSRACWMLAAGTSLVSVLAPVALPPLPALLLGPGVAPR